MIDEVDAQKELEEVQGIITECETVAIEIEKQFTEFEAVIGSTESRMDEVATDLAQKSSEIVVHTERTVTELTASVEVVSTKVQNLLETVESAVSIIVERAAAVFDQMENLDGTHTDIQAGLDENAARIQEIFTQISDKWGTVTQAVTTLQETSHEGVDADVRQLTETQAEEQTSWQQETTEQILTEYTDDIITNVNQHLENIAGNFEEDFSSKFESMLEDNQQKQQQGGQEFSEMRTNTLDSMFEEMKGLYDAATGIMNSMETTMTTTSEVADTVVDAMDQTNIGLDQLMQAIENLLSLLGGLSID